MRSQAAHIIEQTLALPSSTQSPHIIKPHKTHYKTMVVFVLDESTYLTKTNTPAVTKFTHIQFISSSAIIKSNISVPNTSHIKKHFFPYDTTVPTFMIKRLMYGQRAGLHNMLPIMTIPFTEFNINTTV